MFFDESLVVPLSTLCAEFQLKNLNNKRESELIKKKKHDTVHTFTLVSFKKQ